MVNDYAREWETHTHDGDPTIVRYESDSGRISIYYGDDGVWDLYPCEATSLAKALTAAVVESQLRVRRN